MQDCLARIHEYSGHERPRFDASHLVQDAVIRNLQTLAESSHRLSTEIKLTEPEVPWREPSGFRNVIVLGDLGVDPWPSRMPSAAATSRPTRADVVASLASGDRRAGKYRAACAVGGVRVVGFELAALG